MRESLDLLKTHFRPKADATFLHVSHIPYMSVKYLHY